jgi:ABC-type multidrug transport system ATPase subunit
MTVTIEKQTTESATTPAQSWGEPAIRVSELTKRFGSFTAVDSVSFEVPQGSIFGFLGPNGAGKTTTLGVMLGLIPATSGTATIFGFDIHANLPEALRRTGAMVEKPALYPYMSGRDNLRLGHTLPGSMTTSALNMLWQKSTCSSERTPNSEAIQPG